MKEKAKECIDGDWDRGYVFYKPEGGKITRLLETKAGSLEYQVCKSANASGLGFDFSGSLAQINAVKVK